MHKLTNHLTCNPAMPGIGKGISIFTERTYCTAIWNLVFLFFLVSPTTFICIQRFFFFFYSPHSLIVFIMSFNHSENIPPLAPLFANILWSTLSGHIKLIDFGLSRVIPQSPGLLITKVANMTHGTPIYQVLIHTHTYNMYTHTCTYRMSSGIWLRSTAGANMIHMWYTTHTLSLFLTYTLSITHSYTCQQTYGMLLAQDSR
jgi:serine/threonine protein kinase